MAHNILRPSLLNAEVNANVQNVPNVQIVPNAPIEPNAANVGNFQNAVAPNLQVLELQQMIEAMVTSAFSNHVRNAYIANAQPTLNEDSVDQVIEDRFRGNINEIDRIPDVVRSLRDFSGNPCEFSSWKKSVDRVLQIYEFSKGSPRYYGILSVIRNKIIGDADVVLESYSTPLNWNAISKCLMLHYADKRDIGTLEYELMSLRQGNNSVEEFYKKVYNHLSLILNKVSCMDIGHDSIILLTKTYREKTLDTFIRGLNGDLPRLLAISNPTDLPQALQMCQKLENQNFMNAHVNSSFGKTYKQPIQPTRTATVQRQPPNYSQPFYPQLAHLPHHNKPFFPSPTAQFNNQNVHMPNFTQHYSPQPQQFVQRPSAPMPMPVQPMDVDPSMQTRRINYMNRPNNNNNNFQYNKRPASSFANMQKKQRNFNINNELQQQSSGSAIDYNEVQEPQDQGYYAESEQNDFADIHFLG